MFFALKRSVCWILLGASELVQVVNSI